MNKKNGNLIYLLLISLPLLIIQGCVQQTLHNDYSEQLTDMQESMARMQKDIVEIKQNLKNNPQTARKQKKIFKPSSISIEGSPFLGKADAPITLVEFTDYLCPFCKRHAKSTIPLLKTQFIDTGKLKYVLREYPIAKLHPKSYKLSMAALCAGDQGQYWTMHDAFFNAKSKPNPDNLGLLIKKLKLDKKKFNTCLSTKKFNKQIDKDLADGSRLGVSGTPAFIIGKTNPDNPDLFQSIQFIKGAQPYHRFKQAIEKLLSQ